MEMDVTERYDCDFVDFIVVECFSMLVSGEECFDEQFRAKEV